MNALDYVAQGRISLHGRRTLRLEDGRDVTLLVARGAIRVRLDRNGGAVVSAAGRKAVVSLAAPDGDPGRVVLSGIGSKGPVQLAPTQQPERVARQLAALGVARIEAALEPIREAA